MEVKVLLYDAYDKKVGETFMRRARQLVKQQRAEWIDGSQSAIRFAPDVDDWETVSALGDVKESASTVDPIDARLIALAEKRIRERMLFIIHSIACAPIWFVLVHISGNYTRNMEWPMFFTGVCLTAYLIHLYQFASTRISTEERRARRLATEVAHLKAELQRQGT